MAKTFKDHAITIYGNDSEILDQRTFSVEYFWHDRVFDCIFSVYGNAISVIIAVALLALAICIRVGWTL